MHRVSTVCWAVLLTAALLLPPAAAAQSSTDKTRLVYGTKAKTLTVIAVSSVQPSVTLTGAVVFCVSFLFYKRSLADGFAITVRTESHDRLG